MELATELEKKTAKTKNFPLLMGLTALFILILGFVLSLYIYQRDLQPVNSQSRVILVDIPTGSATNAVSRTLYQKGLIKSQLAFQVYARWHGYDGKLKAGEYQLSTNMSVNDILQKLRAGQVLTYKFTIPEGYTTRQISEVLAKKGLVNREKFMNLVANGQFNYDFLKGAPEGERRLEGFLFPDTYTIEKGTTEEEIINMMLREFQKQLTPTFREEAQKRNMTVRQVVILASVVEREARTEKDRKLVSAVFQNRLAKKMKLESCATVQYIIGEPNKKVLSYKDIAIDSKYNTYKYAGLPVGPIASPGKAALEAVLNPPKVNYLYFVAKPDGTNEFTATMAEHEAAKKKYLR